MSASEKLRAWRTPERAITPIFRKTGSKVLGVDAFSRDRETEHLQDVLLPLIAEVVRTAEATAYYECKVCGFSPRNRANWCDLGCGRDYNEMRLIPMPALTALREQLEGSEVT